MQEDDDHKPNQNSIGKRIVLLANKPIHLKKFLQITHKANRAYSLLLVSNTEDDDHNSVVLQINRLVINITIPRIIKPLEVGVYSYSEGRIKDTKKRWSHQFAVRKYGISFFPKETIFNFHYGHYTGNSRGFPTDKMTNWKPSFTKYKLSRLRVIGKNDKVFWENKALGNKELLAKDISELLTLICPKARFEITDPQGRRILGSAHIEERKWSAGWYIFNRMCFTLGAKHHSVLRVHLQINPMNDKDKPTRERYDFTVLVNESIDSAIRRFCNRQLNITTVNFK